MQKQLLAISKQNAINAFFGSGLRQNVSVPFLEQLTGKDNYFWFAASLEITPEEAAEYLETFEGAAQSACWFWETNKLNKFVDGNDFKGLTRAINGGYIGLADREHHYEIALAMLDTGSRLA